MTEKVPALPQLPVAILAGGLATRLGELAKDRPKSLVKVAGRPMLDWQLELLAAAGFERVVLCAGHLGDQLEEHAASYSGPLYIEVVHDAPDARGTADALRAALPRLGPCFAVMYGDSFLEFDYAGAVAAFIRDEPPRAGMMTVYRNDNQLLASNVAVHGDIVTAYNKMQIADGARWIDFGFLVLRASALTASDDPDLSAVLEVLAIRQEIVAHEVHTRFWEIGTPESHGELDRELASRRT